MRERNVALVGKFAAGKTTVAQVLVDDYDYTRVSMAGNMKMITREVYGTLDKAELVPCTRRDGSVYELSIREVLQKLGESVKDFDRDMWLKWMLNDTEYMPGSLVMDDTRLPFEVDTLRERGWLIVKLEVPDLVRMDRYMDCHGTYPTLNEMNHVSETSIDDIQPDFVVNGELSPEVVADEIMSVATLEL